MSTSLDLRITEGMGSIKEPELREIIAGLPVKDICEALYESGSWDRPDLEVLLTKELERRLAAPPVAGKETAVVLHRHDRRYSDTDRDTLAVFSDVQRARDFLAKYLADDPAEDRHGFSVETAALDPADWDGAYAACAGDRGLTALHHVP
jgi:hypothetical protein